MKLIKKIATVCMAVMFAFGLGTFTACKDTGSSSESSGSGASETLTAYKFIVLNADETPAQNVSVQLCAYKEDGSLGACYQPVAVDANGIADKNPAGLPGAGVYQIHILDASSNPVEFDGATDTPAEYSEITLTLKN